VPVAPWGRYQHAAGGATRTADHAERARRQDRLQRAEAAFDTLPFDSEPSRVYGLIYAATALSAGLPIYTRNPDDFRSLTTSST